MEQTVFDIVYDDEWQSEMPDSVDSGTLSPEDALVLSMNEFGTVHLPYMSAVSGLSKRELVCALEGKAIWKDPCRYNKNRPYEAFLTREQYVRGNLFRLFAEAVQAHEETGLFAENIRLLKAELPEGPVAEDIAVTLGATWVPAEYYLQFICETLDMKDVPPELTLDTYFGKWFLRGGEAYNRRRNYAVYGTQRMPALRIIEHTMNASPIRVYDRFYEPHQGKMKAVLNRVETMAAQEKQQVLIREFHKWLAVHEDVRSRLQEIYSVQYGFQVCRYSGSYLQFPDMNPEITLYRHQKDAVARIILSPGNVLLSHDVGAGKTYAFASGIHECLRMGLSKKALLVVPKAVFTATAEAVRKLYPEGQLEVLPPGLFIPSKLEGTLKTLQETREGFFLIASSSFDMISMSKDFHLQQLAKEMRTCAREMQGCRDYARKARLKAEHERLAKKYKEFQESEESAGGCFDRLGIDLLVVDECHTYKNISLHTNMEPVVGMHSKGSRKAERMLEKCDFVTSGGGRLVFATGTPLTNSMADLFVLQRYLQYEELKMLKISRFHEWVNTFCTKHTEFEIDSSASSFRFVTRFDRFHNLPELMALFGNVCDFYHIDAEELGLPIFNGYKNVSVPRSEAQAAYIRSIAARAEAIRRREVSPKEDNYLKLTMDGRKCALDIRLVEEDRKAPEEKAANAVKLAKAANISKDVKTARTTQATKASFAADRIRDIYAAFPGKTQVLFCDLSTPGKGFHIYGEMKRLLVMSGIPEHEIAFIHDSASDSARNKLLREFNLGHIRVLLGSTAKLGQGVNIQERLIAVHHLDAPWKPSDMVQREGRALRQGNSNEEVLVFRYVTESSFDAYTWQILENKQRFISSFLSGTLNPSQRSGKDIGDMVLDYSEIKALAVGSPLIRERVRISNSLIRARASASHRSEELRDCQRALAELPEERKRLMKQISAVRRDLRFYHKITRPQMNREEKNALGSDILKALGESCSSNGRAELPAYCGFRVLIPGGQTEDHPYILLSRSPEISYRVDMKEAREGGCCTRMDNVLQSFGKRIKDMTVRLKGIENSITDAREQLEKGNPYQETVSKLSEQLEETDRKLKEAMKQ